MKLKPFLFAFLAHLFSLTATAYNEEIDGIHYNFSGTQATVASGDKHYSGAVTIPSSVSYNGQTYEVTRIGDRAFQSYNLTSITIPESVTSIGFGAFSYCSGLTSITISNSVTSIGDWAFGNCSSLTSIIIPNCLTRIGQRVFQNCKGLTSVIIPNSVTNIGIGAFENCEGLTSITIPKSVTIIEWGAFKGCSSLTSVTIPESVTSFDGSAFLFCSSLTSINVEEGNTIYDSRDNCNAIVETETNVLIAGCQNTLIPNSVTSIGKEAFCGCTGLTSVTIPESVTYIGNLAFSGCRSLTSIIIPESVTNIDGSPFRSCNSLTSIVVKEGNPRYDSRNECNAIIETTSNKLIAGCKNTIIPESVTSIDGFVFSGCSGLTSITIPNSVTSIGGYAFSGCSGLTSITIPNSVTSIEGYTFWNCSSLTSVTIPNSVTEISYGMFYGCHSLNYIKMGMATPPTISDGVFNESNYGNATLCVPRGSKAAYQAADVWKDFGEIVEYDCEVVVDNQTIAVGGSTMMEVSLNNFSSDLVAFQMDLTLPEGVSIDKTGCSLSSRITDEDWNIAIGKLDNGTYRLLSASRSLIPISGNNGALLTLKLTAENGCVGGQSTISNICFSTSNSERITTDDETFDISVMYKVIYTVDGEAYKTVNVVYNTKPTLEAEPAKDGYTFGGWSELPETMPAHDVEVTGRFYLYGDVNTDEEVDVVDVVDIARFVVATPSEKFREKLADLNYDNFVNIGDAVTLVNHIVGNQNFVKALDPSCLSYDYDLCQLQLQSTGQDALSLCLDGEADFTAFQFDVDVPEGTDISAISINGMRKDGHKLLYNKLAEGRYRVTAFSFSNAVFKDSKGELLQFCINGQATDDICVHDIHFITTTGKDITFDALYVSGTETGVNSLQESETSGAIYDLQGRKLSKMQPGVNIINGKKVVSQ